MAQLSKAEVESWPEGQRRCWGCKAVKPVEDFGIDVNCRGGRNPRCRACRKVKSKSDYESQSQEYRIFYRAKRRAKKEGLPFDLTEEDVVIPETCPVFGVPFVVGDPDWTPSLDKLIPSRGYVKGNVYVICNKANRLKNDGTLEEFKMILAYIEKNNQGEEKQ